MTQTTERPAGSGEPRPAGSGAHPGLAGVLRQTVLEVSRAHLILLGSVQPLPDEARAAAEEALEQLEVAVRRLRNLAVRADCGRPHGAEAPRSRGDEPG